MGRQEHVKGCQMKALNVNGEGEDEALKGNEEKINDNQKAAKGDISTCMC